MNMKRLRKLEVTVRSAAITAIAVMIGLSAPSPTHAAVALAVVPDANFDTEGNDNNLIPFGSATFCEDGIRYQQLYTGAQIGGPMISDMAFRLDIIEDPVGPTTLTGVTVTLSSTLHTQATMSRTFAENTGPDAQVVYSGDLVVDMGVNGSAPNPFDLVIPFDAPFAFDGSKANLLVDITILGCPTGDSFAFDAALESDDVMRIWSPDKDNEVAFGEEGSTNGDPIGLVTQFTVYSDPPVFVPYSMGAGGNWTIVGHDGEGFLFEPNDSGTLVVFWFTYDALGNQMWLIGVEDAYNYTYDPDTGAETFTVAMFLTSGPVFGPDYDPTQFQETYAGSATFHLTHCQADGVSVSTVDYDLNFGLGSGTYEIRKLYDIYKNDCTP